MFRFFENLKFGTLHFYTEVCVRTLITLFLEGIHTSVSSYGTHFWKEFIRRSAAAAHIFEGFLRCPHGPRKHIFEAFLAVRMVLANTFVRFF